jgi:thiol-disulfide isomerase/thioredoxin
LQFLGAQREASKKVEPLLAACREKKDEACIKKYEAELIAINDAVNKYQLNYIKTYPDYFSAKFIQTSMDVKVPKEVKEENQYRYYRNHFFDNLDLGDGRLIRTPLVPQKIDRYLDKVIPQHPDSVIAGVDVILNRSEKDEDMFKYMLIKLVNKYAQSKVVCMDAVYVHIVDNYYLKNKAEWIDKDQLDKMKENADRLRPILCNKVAPDLKMQTIPKKEGDQPQVVSLHGIKSKFTVMIFWAPDCGHCKKSMPKIVEFYDNYKSKGVEIFSICTKTYKDYQNCVDFTREKDMIRMLNVTDPYLKSKFPVIYDIKSTPVIFLLDENKVILAKRLAAEQLGEVIDSWLKRYERLEKEKEQGK